MSKAFVYQTSELCMFLPSAHIQACQCVCCTESSRAHKKRCLLFCNSPSEKQCQVMCAETRGL